MVNWKIIGIGLILIILFISMGCTESEFDDQRRYCESRFEKPSAFIILNDRTDEYYRLKEEYNKNVFQCIQELNGGISEGDMQPK